MKTILIIALSLLTALPMPAKNSTGKALKTSYWQKMADGMSNALIEKFWGANFEGHSTRYYFNYGSNM